MKIKKGIGIICICATAVLWSGCFSAAAKSNQEGLAKYEAGEFAEACRLFGRAISQNDTETSYYVNLGMAEIQMGEYDWAKEHFQQALRLEEDNMLAYRGLGLACLASEEYDLSIEYLNQAIDCGDRSVGKLDYDIIGYRAEAQTKAGQLKEAEASYTQLIDLEVQPTQHYIKRGSVRLKDNRVEAALEDFWAAAAKEPNNFAVYLEIYKTLAQFQVGESGETFLYQALEIPVKSHEDRVMRGRILMLLGDRQEAMELFHQAAEGGSGDASLLLARCYEDLGQYSEAEMIYQQLLAQDTDNARVYNQLAICKQKQGQFEKALTMVRQGISIGDPTVLPDLYWNEAMIYEAMGEYGFAYEKLEEYGQKFSFDEESGKEAAFLKTR